MYSTAVLLDNIPPSWVVTRRLSPPRPPRVRELNHFRLLSDIRVVGGTQPSAKNMTEPPSERTNLGLHSDAPLSSSSPIPAVQSGDEDRLPFLGTSPSVLVGLSPHPPAGSTPPTGSLGRASINGASVSPGSKGTPFWGSPECGGVCGTAGGDGEGSDFFQSARGRGAGGLEELQLK